MPHPNQLPAIKLLHTRLVYMKAPKSRSLSEYVTLTKIIMGHKKLKMRIEFPAKSWRTRKKSCQTGLSEALLISYFIKGGNLFH